MSRETKTKADREHLASVKQMSCLLLGRARSLCIGPVQAHHVTDGGRRLGDFYSLPLCWGHHDRQSPVPMGEAVHKGTKLWEERYGKQEDLVVVVNRRCNCSTCKNNRNNQTEEI